MRSGGDLLVLLETSWQTVSSRGSLQHELDFRCYSVARHLPPDKRLPDALQLEV